MPSGGVGSERRYGRRRLYLHQIHFRFRIHATVADGRKGNGVSTRLRVGMRRVQVTTGIAIPKDPRIGVGTLRLIDELYC